MKTPSEINELTQGLNEPQLSAVTSDSQYLRVLAGAGSGKTRVLTQRIAWLIENGYSSPWGVLAVTFTNKAAKEMQNRIETALGRSIQGMWVGTFHGLCHRLLRTHWQQAGLGENFQVIDSDDQLRVLKRIMKAMNIDEKVLAAKQVQWFINEQKDEGRRAKHIDAGFDPTQKLMKTIYQAYEKQCELSLLVDFGELILRAHELWLNSPETLAQYQQRFQYVLVDEFQDINTIQYAWLRVLVGNPANSTTSMVIVGDDDQSIYGWRGAKVENIQQFDTDFPGVETVRLEQNYRSTGNILAAANAVISVNQSRLGKKLWTDDSEGDPIRVYCAFNEIDEANFVADQIKESIQKGDSADDSAILYRSNAQSRMLEESLLRRNVPYRIYGGLRFYERAEIKNALCYLRILMNRHDDPALERIINVPTRGIGNKSLEVIREYAREQGSSMWQALVEVVRNKLLSARAITALQKFIEMMQSIENDCQEQPLRQFGELILNATGLLEFHRTEKGEKGATRVENLQELLGAMQQFTPNEEDDKEAHPLALFLDRASLDAGDTQADEFEAAVTLMTLHSSKGLEFNQVYLVGVEEGLFPNKRSMNDISGLEEERRLAYVGITRARKQLCISHAESRRLFGQESYNPPSRFLGEIPDELTQTVRSGSMQIKQTQFRREPSAPKTVEPLPIFAQRSQNDAGFAAGDKVSHAKFGDGVVLRYEGEGANGVVEVSFAKASVGTKRLMLKFAKLEKV
jgi:DNA helicase II / ATP-dependent DNA helicase PcrA